MGFLAEYFSLIFFVKNVPNPLSSTLKPLFKAIVIPAQKMSTISSKSDLFKLGFLFLRYLIKFGSTIIYFFFTIAFSKYISVAPDLVAPSPNFAINDFSSSIEQL